MTPKADTQFLFLECSVVPPLSVFLFRCTMGGEKTILPSLRDCRLGRLHWCVAQRSKERKRRNSAALQKKAEEILRPFLARNIDFRVAQEPRRLLRRYRVDVKARSPLEA